MAQILDLSLFIFDYIVWLRPYESESHASLIKEVDEDARTTDMPLIFTPLIWKQGFSNQFNRNNPIKSIFRRFFSLSQKHLKMSKNCNFFTPFHSYNT